MDGYSQTPKEERIKVLRALIPEAFDEGTIDFEKLRATLGCDVNISNERYVLNWAGKSDAFRVMQLPSSETLAPCREESVNFDTTQNLFIEGENMEVLKILQRSYFDKVKMIYIDPPYNTGSDSFIYPDKFSESKDQYLRRVGDKNEEGYMTREGLFQKNSKENGQYHSNWLSMMMPRLYLAKSLLREDGVIFISIDDHEVHDLRLLMNEIFGEENFVAQIVWQKKYAATNDSKGFSTTHDYILVYQKSSSFSRNLLPRTRKQNLPYKYDDNDGKGLWRPDNLLAKSFSQTGVFPIVNPNTGKKYYPPKGGCWRTNEESMQAWLSENRIFFGKKGKGAPQLKRYLNEVQQGSVPVTWWSFEDVGHNDAAKKELQALFNSKAPFDTPKPTTLIEQMLRIASSKEDVVLDFFSGSATTAHAVMHLNAEDGGHRKFIMVQLPEEILNKESEAFSAGYKTIAEIGKERIRRAGAQIKKEIKAKRKKQKAPIVIPDLGFKVFKQQESNFKEWRKTKGSDKEVWKQQLIDFQDPVADNAATDNMIYELLLKNGKDLNSNIEYKDGYYTINGKELVLMLDGSLTQDIVDTIIALQPEKVIALDRLFEGNDPFKTNTALQMRDADIEFRTI